MLTESVRVLDHAMKVRVENVSVFIEAVKMFIEARECHYGSCGCV
jgi:hypothetical protein